MPIPVVSFFNFKGGVGKTTISANLAAALSDHWGISPLLVDCDWQGSLTSWFVTGDEYDDLASHDTKKLLHCLFDNSLPPNSQLATHIPRELQNARLLGCDGRLGDAEDVALLKWYADCAPIDPRYALRDWLSTKEVYTGRDVVLIDCPPRLSTSAVSALLASDYLVVPVLPNLTSTNALRILFKILREHITPLNSRLRILGVVINKRPPRGLTNIQKALFEAERVPQELRDSWGSDVRIFGISEGEKGLSIPTFPGSMESVDDMDFQSRTAEFQDVFKELARSLFKGIIRKI